MNSLHYILASLRQYRRIHLATAAGVAVAAAVITGALAVGDSMRGSLRDLALAGLGRIEAALIAEQPFRAALAAEWAARPELAARRLELAPLLTTRGALTFQQNGQMRRATRIEVLGVPLEFWRLTPTGQPPDFRAEGVGGGAKAAADQSLPIAAGNEIAMTAGVAEELGVEVGQFVLLRAPRAGAAPADSTLGEKEDTTVSRRLRVMAVLPDGNDASLGRFSLRPSQQSPRNAFVPLAMLQELLELDGRANVIVLAAPTGENAVQPAESAASEELIAGAAKALQPTLADFGLQVEQFSIDAESPVAYLRVSAQRLVLPPHVVETVARVCGDAPLQPAVTYLANAISMGDRKIPYSTVVGVDSTAELGPIRSDAGQPIVLADDEIVLNDWAADDLGGSVGEQVTLAFYEPETTHGQLREHAPPLTLTLRAIVPLADADGRSTPAADPNFAPELPGVTDEKSIADWDLPFELVEEVRDRDEQYWQQRRTTPKAFVSHALAARLWGTRWGTDSIVRIPTRIGSGHSELDAATLAAKLTGALDWRRLGMSLQPVRRQAVAAATGTTPFDGLFLGFSMFLLASSIMLAALLFRLGVEGRAAEAGLLAAVGFSPRRLRQLMLAEGAVVAALGSLIGAAAGVAYARLMIHGLNTWWVEATAAPFLRLHVSGRSLAIGCIAGLAAALAAIAWSLRGLLALAPRQLLAGATEPTPTVSDARPWTRVVLPLLCLAGMVGAGAAAAASEGEARAGAFFGVGALALAGILLVVRGKLRESTIAAPRNMTLAGLAARNARRNPGRTMLALALAATASFLIVALSAFRLAPTERGTGGFDLAAISDLPIHYDLATETGRRELGFSAAASQQLADSTILGFRVRDGEDASCLNLYQTAQPRILGAPVAALAESSDFAWAGASSPPVQDGARGGTESHRPNAAPATAQPPLTQPPHAGARSRSQTASPWRLLDMDFGVDDAGRPMIPMILDRNTAFYSLKLYGLGQRLTVRDAAGRDASLVVVGMLANSVLQGDLIIGEANFLRLFPEAAGSRFFLIRRGAATPAGAELSTQLETQIEDYGFNAVDARTRLADLLAVQNTYLSTFQSLGALGLLLGAAGLAVVQLRSVSERRGELALMQAAGFPRRRLMRMILSENLVLLLGGLGVGCAAALAAVLPHAVAERVGVPWATLTILLGIVVVTGAAAAWLASRSVLRAPLLAALRGE